MKNGDRSEFAGGGSFLWGYVCRRADVGRQYSLLYEFQRTKLFYISRSLHPHPGGRATASGHRVVTVSEIGFVRFLRSVLVLVVHRRFSFSLLCVQL